MRKKVQVIHHVSFKGLIIKGRDNLYHIRLEMIQPNRYVDYADTDKRKFKTPGEALKELLALVGPQWEFGGIEVTFGQNIRIDVPAVVPFKNDA